MTLKHQRLLLQLLEEDSNTVNGTASEEDQELFWMTTIQLNELGVDRTMEEWKKVEYISKFIKSIYIQNLLITFTCFLYYIYVFFL